MRIFTFTGVLLLILMTMNSCSNNQNKGLLTVSVDISSASPLPLSEIATDIHPIKLELTDNSLIGRAGRVLYDGHFILVQNNSPRSILLFDNTGKFIRRIGAIGQGPGEYTTLLDIAADFKNKLVYASSYRKLICYDFEGRFIRETAIPAIDYPWCISFINSMLHFIGRYSRESSNENSYFGSSLYVTDDNLQLTDSMELKRVINPRMIWSQHWYGDHITQCDDNTFVYEFEFNPEPFLRDTLFQVKDKIHLHPHLRLDFHTSGMDDSGERALYILNIYRSSRYIFAIYGQTVTNNYFWFCHDTHTGKGYSMKDGFTDDIRHLGTTVNIRPFVNDADMFYYLVTDIEEYPEQEEPNPTLYIGKLKK